MTAAANHEFKSLWSLKSRPHESDAWQQQSQSRACDICSYPDAKTWLSNEVKGKGKVEKKNYYKKTSPYYQKGGKKYINKSAAAPRGTTKARSNYWRNRDDEASMNKTREARHGV